MCFCLGIPNRAHCVFSGIWIIIACSIPLIFITYRGQYDTNSRIVFAGLITTMVAAFCLIFGAIAVFRIAVWVWIVFSIPATLTVVTVYGIDLHEDWATNSRFSNGVEIVFIILYIGMILVALANAILFLRTLSRGELENLIPERQN